MKLSSIIFTEAKKENTSLYSNMVVERNGDNITIKDAKTGGMARLKISSHFNHDAAEEEGLELVIIRWDAAPFSAIATRGLEAQQDYIGGGFARNALAKMLEIAIQENIEIISIFAASNYTQAVFNHYVQKGMFSPIPYSKGVYTDWHSSYMINEPKAISFIGSVKSL